MHGGPCCGPFGQLWAVPTSWLIECQWTAETTLSCGTSTKTANHWPIHFLRMAIAFIYCLFGGLQPRVSIKYWQASKGAFQSSPVTLQQAENGSPGPMQLLKFGIFASLLFPLLPSLLPSFSKSPCNGRLADEFSSDSQARLCSHDATKVGLPINSTIVLAWKLENKFKLNYPILVILLTIKNLLKEKAAYIKNLICCIAICMPLPVY